MFETHVLEFKGDILATFRQFDASALPTLICLGDVFETNPTMSRIRNYFSDFFAPFRNETVFMNADFGMQLVVVLVGFEDQSLAISVSKASAQGTALTDMGVLLRLKVDRTNLAENEHFKEACKQMTSKKKNKKTIEKDSLGETMGRVFVRQQDLKSLKLRRIKKKLGKRDRGAKAGKKVSTEAGSGSGKKEEVEQ